MKNETGIHPQGVCLQRELKKNTLKKRVMAFCSCVQSLEDTPALINQNPERFFRDHKCAL